MLYDDAPPTSSASIAVSICASSVAGVAMSAVSQDGVRISNRLGVLRCYVVATEKGG